MDHTSWERRSRGFGQNAARDEDLERTVALGGPEGAERGDALDETLPLREAAARGIVAQRTGPSGPGGYGAPGGYGGYGPGGHPPGDQGPSARRPLARRKVLLAAGGLTLVGGCGIATAAQLASAGSSPTASPAPSHSPSPSSPPAPTRTPSDLSSSSAAAAPPSPPPDVNNPGSGVNPAQVQSHPEYYVHAGPKVIALTLDDGPSAQFTPKILAVLQQYRIHATFCMIGEQIAANRSLVSEVAAAGHTIVNHTWNHADQSKLSLSGVRSQIARANDALGAVGVAPALFRAPYGAWNHTVFLACAQARLRPLDWSVDPRDWSRPGVSTIVQRIMKNTRTGSIVLEHDGGGDRSQTVAALKIVLPQLLSAGYRFTSV
ncbi:polysaccharide deacetylase family protein [Actinocrinis puniceicyclus]|uniref:Polysaccharide deacetylase family protein n=1 Tax=Actinocrinis puniceicyclus TaxID=977794 RepID=A0A8J8BD88_9ACTN|nr:polysaccharide deacetylase family protein [Actinocrinis puniceicyclus]MBS2965947.1 polysaccharide deacetylase family protein [Actinocrinis puniceicyclus]